MKIKSTKNLTFLIILNLFGCENSSSIQNQYIDPQIIFSSRRWWNYDIFISDIYNGHITQLTKNKWIDFNPSISPDSKKLLFVSDRDGNREIYKANIEWLDGYTQWRGNNLKNLTNSTEHDWTPVYSPVENKIVFSTYFPHNDNYDIFIMNDDGTNKENLTNTSSYEKFPQFSPDGSFIIYQGWEKGKMEIFFLGLLDRNNINLTRNIKYNDIISHGNAFSPNGEYIVFTSERDGNKEIYIIDPITKKSTNLTNNTGDDWNPRFYPDSQKIIFQSTRDGNWEIYMMNVDGNNQTNLTNHPSTDYSYVVLPLINP